jgi:PAS domain S-box-containing protein
MGAESALYNRLNGGMLCSWGRWNTPPDYKAVDKPEGHICYDVINRSKDDVLVIHDLHETEYAHTDPNVKAYGLKTYIGKAVKFGNEYVGSLCTVYKEDFVPGESDLWAIRIIASAIGTEENRRGSKEELKQSEEKYRLLIESIQDGVFIIQDGKIQYANEALAIMGDYKVSEMIGKNFIDIIAPEDRELIGERHVRRLSGESVPKDYEVRVLTRDGKTRRIVNLNVGIINYRGRMAAMGTVKDITERRKVEEALLESEALFRATFEQAAIGMVRVDLTGRPVETNTAFRNMLGYNGKELQAMVFTEFTHPDDAELDKEVFKELVAGKNNTFQIKNRFIRKNGGIFWGRLTVSLVRDPEGKPQFAIGMIEDITERKEAEEKMQRSEEKYRTLIDNIQDGLFIIQDFKIEFANEAFARMAGYAEEDVIGKDFREFIAPEDLGMVVDYYRSRQKGETVPKEYEFNAMHKNGKTRITVNVNVGLMNYRGRVAIIGTLKDITERKRSEEKLLLFRNLIDRSNDAIFVNEIETGLIIDANDKACSSLGYTKEELFNMRVFEIEDVIPDHFSWKEHVEEVKENGHLILEGRQRRKDGSTFPVEVNVNNIVLGKNEYTVAVARDITERKRAEEMRKEKARAELYGFIVSALPVFASGVPSSIRNSLISNFAERFEKNFLPKFKEEMKSPEFRQKDHDLDTYMQWLSGLFSNFGIQNKTIPDGTKRILEFMNCPWASEAQGNPIFCFICRSIVIRSFTWTSLKGTPVQNSSIASGSEKCTFDINV